MQNLFVGILVEAYEKSIALYDCGRSQIARRTKQQLAELFTTGLFFLEVDVDNFRSLQNIQFFDL